MGVSFDETGGGSSRVVRQTSQLGAVGRLFIKLGLAKTERSAHTAMLVVAVLALLAAGYFLFFTGGSKTPVMSPEEQEARMLEERIYGGR